MHIFPPAVLVTKRLVVRALTYDDIPPICPRITAACVADMSSSGSDFRKPDELATFVGRAERHPAQRRTHRFDLRWRPHARLRHVDHARAPTAGLCLQGDRGVPCGPAVPHQVRRLFRRQYRLAQDHRAQRLCRDRTAVHQNALLPNATGRHFLRPPRRHRAIALDRADRRGAQALLLASPCARDQIVYPRLSGVSWLPKRHGCVLRRRATRALRMRTDGHCIDIDATPGFPHPEPVEGRTAPMRCRLNLSRRGGVASARVSASRLRRTARRASRA